ncbi:MAG: Trp family transcriptional regulator, partial [Christensenellales bacterium]
MAIPSRFSARPDPKNSVVFLRREVIMNNGHHADETALYELIAKVGTAKEAEELFADLCTMNEIAAMAQRLAAAKLLIEGKTYE